MKLSTGRDGTGRDRGSILTTVLPPRPVVAVNTIPSNNHEKPCIYSVGRHNSTKRQVNEEASVKSPRDKNARHVVWTGENSLLCDPGSELRLLIGESRTRGAKITNGIKARKKKKKV